MDFDTTKFSEFIEKHNLKLIQCNIRSWGTYELAMSFDEWRSQFHDGQAFGYAFSTHEAASITFKKYIETNASDATFNAFVGPERLQELKDIVQNLQ